MQNFSRNSHITVVCSKPWLKNRAQAWSNIPEFIFANGLLITKIGAQTASPSLGDKNLRRRNIIKYAYLGLYNDIMDLTFDETAAIDSIPEETPGKVVLLLSGLKEKIKGQMTAIDNKKQLLKNLEEDKSELDEKITALELKIRAAKSLTGNSESDKQERANVSKVVEKNFQVKLKIF